VGVAHAELLLVTCLRKENPPGKKISSCQYVFCGDPCSLQYLKAKLKLVLCWGEREERAIEHVPAPPELSKISLSVTHLVVFLASPAVPSKFEKSGRCPC
jgi:hypothetical protein